MVYLERLVCSTLAAAPTCNGYSKLLVEVVCQTSWQQQHTSRGLPKSDNSARAAHPRAGSLTTFAMWATNCIRLTESGPTIVQGDEIDLMLCQKKQL